MQLIGMLDSPYVRRVAISLQLLDLPFEHRPISVFRGLDEYQRINPVVKAPSLVCDDGEVLMDSTLILDYAEGVAGTPVADTPVAGTPARSRKTLLPLFGAARVQALRTIGLALAACEKSVQIFYERNLRPGAKMHEPWVTRITWQLLAAYTALETIADGRPLADTRDTIDQAGLTTAVAWHFTQAVIPDVVDAARFPLLADYSARAERLPEFRAAPHGEGTYRAACCSQQQ